MTSPQPPPPTGAPPSGIRDNYSRGTVGDFLQARIPPDSRLSIVSAYFTIYGFDALKASLSRIHSLRFLFGEPRFLRALDPDKTDQKAFNIEDEAIQLANRLEQRRAARECADWIIAKVEIRSVRQTSLLHGKMYHIIWANVTAPRTFASSTTAGWRRCRFRRSTNASTPSCSGGTSGRSGR